MDAMGTLEAKIEAVERKIAAIEFVLDIGGQDNALVPGFRMRPIEWCEAQLLALQDKENKLLDEKAWLRLQAPPVTTVSAPGSSGAAAAPNPPGAFSVD